ncbi:amino acid ABC transporter permease [Bradyrhizobium sp. KBS0727]|uniref:amino acid ABC transporter permease n=1 Tax=unclassified Bradyrhizobium TaxID=2631580 RepID=UPI00110EB7D7|nr:MULTISPECIES: amino acid ABC transporter permease [unclassified Bradyrhizobium]QDW38910.1 amino acid ABC transporter permease [Bradyrhizobium sp. KBS0725]QDW45513.1 amino acid ABC transporter permease [Bradyrhizobium sp. KBS0727]
MTDILTPQPFVSDTLIAERPAPIKTTGFIGFLRTRLFNSPTNILITIVSALALWFIVVPALKFVLVDAVWTGTDRNACLPKNAGDVVGACWPFVQAKFSQFIYGFYPEPERWRVNLTFILAAILLLPLLIPRLPAKGPNAILFFLAFPVVAFFLLYGGGLGGLGVSWTVGILSGFNDSIGEGGRKVVAAGDTAAVIGPLLWGLGKLIVLISALISWVLLPLTWLRDQIQAFGRPVWADFVATAAIVSGLLFWLGGGTRTGWRPLITCLGIFAGIGLVIAGMGLDRGGLPVVDTRLWGGLLVTLVVSVVGIVASMPVGIALALGRRASIPLIRIFSITFIEFWRGVPLITVLFFATYMLPLFVPTGFTIDGLMRALIGIALFAGAYQAEVIRGGLQAIPRGQAEAASALGLSWAKTTALIVMPQALRHVIPGLVNSFIALFKDTSLVSIVALFDLLGQLRASFSDPVWSTPTTLFTGFAFTGIIYFVFCFGMSRYSLFVENRLNAHRRN